MAHQKFGLYTQRFVISTFLSSYASEPARSLLLDNHRNNADDEFHYKPTSASELGQAIKNRSVSWNGHI